MRIHYIQHVPFEGLGYIENFIGDTGYTLSATKVWEEPVFPEVRDFDVLIIMGGPMGVYDDHLHHWLADEKFLISQAVRENKKIIGICLGAQLLASVLGAFVYTNRQKEIGWFPVSISSSFSQWLGADVSNELKVFHWHGDKFDIPYGAVNHVTSAACNHQLFTYGDNIIGLQFHLEATVDTIEAMLTDCGHELNKQEYVQSAEEIRAGADFSEPNRLMQHILKKILLAH